MKHVLWISAAAALLPFVAHAADEKAKPFEGQLTASTSYIKEDEAYVQSRRPYIGGELDWNQTENLSGWVVGQLGDKGGTQVMVGETVTKTFGSVTAHVEAVGYFYPKGGKPIYSAEVGGEVPFKGFTLAAYARQYTGAYTGGVASGNVSHAIGPTKLTVGYAYNWVPQGQPGAPEIHVLYAQLSIPLGKPERGWSVLAHGFAATNTTPHAFIALDLVKRF